MVNTETKNVTANRRIDELMAEAEKLRLGCRSRHMQHQAMEDVEQMYQAVLLELFERLRPYSNKFTTAKESPETNVEKIWSENVYPIVTRHGNQAIDKATGITYNVSKPRKAELETEANQRVEQIKAHGIDASLEQFVPWSGDLVHEINGIKNLGYISDLSCEVTVTSSNISDHSKTEQMVQPDWLVKDILYAIHADMSILATHLGFGAKIKEELPTDKI